jgi:plastocyanin
VLTRGLAIFLALLAATVPLAAASIEGTVVIKKKLTKPRVTASVPLYQRGPVVALDSDTEIDALALERSRVAVYLEGRFPPETPGSGRAATAVMEQSNRRFSPETLVISAGSTVSFPNMDPIFHNVFSLSGPKTFDLGNYTKGDTRLVTFPAPGIVYVNCHLHSNMTGTIVVTPNKWNTKPDSEGRFVLRDVAPGKYTIVAWHKAAGFFRQQVQVGPDRDEKIEFLIPLDENGRRMEPQKLAAARVDSQKR